MTGIAVLGAGAFGTALAVSFARAGRTVTLWGRDAASVRDMRETRKSNARLSGIELPDGLEVTDDLDIACKAEVVLLAVPMQSLAALMATAAPLLAGKDLVACCKGIDLQTGQGPASVIGAVCPGSRPAVLTGPSFAIDIARGLPTALTLAAQSDATAQRLQSQLSTPTIRLYRTTDIIGAELGGALKNVVALAAGMAIGAGLGDSARAAVVARGFAEMTRFAIAHGARPETLNGLSGLGDLVLTCTSAKSRNFAAGAALGGGKDLPDSVTIEGVATARAVARIAADEGLDMPLTTVVARVLDGAFSVTQAVDVLLSRPLKQE